MTTRLQRFDFGSLRDFRGPLVVPPVAPEIIEEAIHIPVPPTYSEDELLAANLTAQQKGYAEGFEAGLARGAAQVDAKRLATETVILNIGQQVQGLQESYQRLLDREAQDLSQLIHMIARKVAGEALDANCAGTITSLVTSCLPVLLSKPRLNIELHPDSFEQVIGPIESLLQVSGFEGEIQFRTNGALGIHDAVLDWGVGTATRNTATLWQEIETLLAAMPVTLAPLDAQADIFNQESPATEQNGSDFIDDILPPA